MKHMFEIVSGHRDGYIMFTQSDNSTLCFQVLHKKYQSGHKYHATAVDKSTSALKKHKKKTKNKYGYDQKEIQVRGS